MGIRLYFRNKKDPEHDFCLGKYFSYAEKKDGIYKCVKFLLDVGCVDHLIEEWRDQYNDTDDINAFLELTDCYKYIDYGEFFELNTINLCGFLAAYICDREKLWGYNLDHNYIISMFQFINENGRNDLWEFKLGA